MQKINKKASILIWSIFLSLIISISFFSIATKITKTLKSQDNLYNNIIQNIKIENKLKSINTNNAYLYDISIEIENKTLKKSLKKYEIFTINFPKSSSWTLELTSSWIIYYEFWSEKWFLDNTNTKYNFWNKNWNLKIENYSWIVSFELNADNKFEFSQKKYTIIQEIWNKKIIKQFWLFK